MPWIFFIGFLLVVSQSAWAQVLEQNLPKAEVKRFGGFISATGSSNFENTPGLRESGLSASFILDYKAGGKNTLRFGTGISHNLEEQQRNVRDEYRLHDSYFAWRHPYALSESVFMLADARLTLPTSDFSRNRDGVLARTTIRPLFIVNMDRAMGIKHTSLIYIPAYTRSFNRYDQQIMGGPIVRDQFAHIGVIEYNLPRNFTLNIGAIYSSQWNQQGFRMDDSFSGWQEIIYAPKPNIRLALGHNNRGSIYQPDGSSNNIQLYNFDTSSYYLSTMFFY